MLSSIISPMALLQVGFVLGDSDLAAATEDVLLWAVKLLLIVAGILYLIFGFIVTRQITVMRNTLITSFSPLLNLLGLVHLGVGAVVLLFFVLLPV